MTDSEKISKLKRYFEENQDITNLNSTLCIYNEVEYLKGALTAIKNIVNDTNYEITDDEPKLRAVCDQASDKVNFMLCGSDYDIDKIFLHDDTDKVSQDVVPRIGTENTAGHKAICDFLNYQYESKNADYGDSFSKSVKKYGLIAALTRISDKFNRIENLILNKDQKVADEKINDTLLDLANYCIMTVMEIENGVR